MKLKTLVLSGLMMGVLQACSPGSDESVATEANEEPQHVWKDQVKALDKAKNLEQEMNEAFEQRSQEMEKQAQ